MNFFIQELIFSRKMGGGASKSDKPHEWELARDFLWPIGSHLPALDQSEAASKRLCELDR